MDASSGLLWQCPPIIKNIFKYLCAKDLSSCAKVCSLWHSMSITENNRRRSVEWFLEVNIGQTMNMDGDLVSAPLPLGTLYPFQERLASVRAQPSYCLVFVTLETLEHVTQIFPNFKTQEVPKKKFRMDYYDKMGLRLKELEETFLNHFLPEQCHLHCISSPGIIGCHDNRSPAEIEGGRGISGLLLPHFPGVSIHHLPLDQTNQWQGPGLPPPPIKCLLVFQSSPSFKPVKSFIDQCIKHNGDSEFAIGGAFVGPVTGGVGSGFFFSGENVEAASVVIDKTTTDVGFELALFKKTSLLENQCFAFMFSCVDKGIGKYSAPNYESSIFRNMYPDVPLVGVFGNGEIGIHYLPNVDKEDPDNKERYQKFTPKKCVRSYNSIFVMLSVKTPK